MDYLKQIEEISNYFRQNEKKEIDFKLGVEFEYFIVDQDTLETISYYGEEGVGNTLKELERMGWNGVYEGEYILSLSKDGITITLEPGCQLEFSIEPEIDIEEIEEQYFIFLNDIIPILESKNQRLIASGYQPHSKIDEIKMIPKERYQFMFEYFKHCGQFAHHMMKGTASMQISIDYKSEEDYINKFKIANALSPVFYAIFDNSPFFEGEVNDHYSLRSHIWENCDSDRCGVVEMALDQDFGYDQYAKYILERPPIFLYDGNTTQLTKEILFKNLFNPSMYTKETLEHVLTMFFPDVRTKKFIEIRMVDSLPFPLNFSVVCLIKGLLYDDENIKTLLSLINGLTYQDVMKAKQEIVKSGVETAYLGMTIIEIMEMLISLAKKALNDEERHYINQLEDLMQAKKTPAQLTKDKIGKHKKELIEWCFITLNKEVKA